MTGWPRSLRGRLVGAMLLVFVLGLLGAVVVDPPQLPNPTLGQVGALPLEEPYQDFTLLAPFGAFAMVIIWMVSGWSLRHLSQASKEAASVGPADPSKRISAVNLPGEIQPLVQAFNGALDRLAEAYEVEQRFVAQAAHELRTPLAVLSLRLQRAKVAPVVDWGAIEKDLADVTGLVTRLLDLARKEHARKTQDPAQYPVTNMSRIAREALAGVIPLVEEAGRSVDVDLPRVLNVPGRSADLHDMIRNLLENAIRHGKGTVSVVGTIKVKENGDAQAVLIVADEGPGVPSHLRERVFNRFEHVDPSAQGHGLGLSIVREVARGHGGSVEMVPGATCKVRVSLPAVRPVSPSTPDRSQDRGEVRSPARPAVSTESVVRGVNPRTHATS